MTVIALHDSVIAVPTGLHSRGGDAAFYVFDMNQPSLSSPFYSVLLSVSVFMALPTVISFHKFPRQLRYLTLFFWSYFCLGPFNYVSLYESLPQHCYNPLWQTGLKAPAN